MMQQHHFAECSCSGNSTTVGIDYTDWNEIIWQPTCAYQMYPETLFLSTAWCDENGCMQLSSAQNSAPNVYEDKCHLINFPPMQHGRQKQWQIFHMVVSLSYIAQMSSSTIECSISIE